MMRKVPENPGSIGTSKDFEKSISAASSRPPQQTACSELWMLALLQPYRAWSWKPATWWMSIANRQPRTCQAGWGPCTVVSAASPDTGHITVRWQGRDMSVRVADLRRAILFACFLSINQGQDPADLLVAFIAELHDRHVRLGWTRSATGWALTAATETHAWPWCT